MLHSAALLHTAERHAHCTTNLDHVLRVVSMSGTLQRLTASSTTRLTGRWPEPRRSSQWCCWSTVAATAPRWQVATPMLGCGSVRGVGSGVGVGGVGGNQVWSIPQQCQACSAGNAGVFPGRLHIAILLGHPSPCSQTGSTVSGPLLFVAPVSAVLPLCRAPSLRRSLSSIFSSC